MSEYRKLKSLKFLYEINEDGVIRNVKSKKVVKGYVEKNGYVRVRFENKCLDGVVRTTVHQLLAEAFIPNPENKSEVNHIDSNRANNTLSNLEWVTHSENMKHAYSKGRINMCPLEEYRNSEKVKVTNGEMVFDSISSAGQWLLDNGKVKTKESGISGVSAVIKGKRKTLGGYEWKVV